MLTVPGRHQLPPSDWGLREGLAPHTSGPLHQQFSPLQMSTWLSPSLPSDLCPEAPFSVGLAGPPYLKPHPSTPCAFTRYSLPWLCTFYIHLAATNKSVSPWTQGALSALWTPARPPAHPAAAAPGRQERPRTQECTGPRPGFRRSSDALQSSILLAAPPHGDWAQREGGLAPAARLCQALQGAQPTGL